jgi:hypothetical protein
MLTRKGKGVKQAAKGFQGGVSKMLRPRETDTLFAGSTSSGSREPYAISYLLKFYY